MKGLWACCWTVLSGTVTVPNAESRRDGIDAIELAGVKLQIAGLSATASPVHLGDLAAVSTATEQVACASAGAIGYGRDQPTTTIAAKVQSTSVKLRFAVLVAPLATPLELRGAQPDCDRVRP
jgi:hypothetical protein